MSPRLQDGWLQKQNMSIREAAIMSILSRSSWPKRQFPKSEQIHKANRPRCGPTGSCSNPTMLKPRRDTQPRSQATFHLVYRLQSFGGVSPSLISSSQPMPSKYCRATDLYLTICKLPLMVSRRNNSPNLALVALWPQAAGHPRHNR